MPDKDWSQIVKDREDEDTELHTRMDDDKKLVELDTYTLVDADNKTIPHAISVTLNDPAVFATNVEAALGASSEQVTIESDDPTLDTGYIEDFISYAFAAANDRLNRLGMFSLEPFIDQMMCRRGGAAARCIFQLKKMKDITGKEYEGLDANITPWDYRFAKYGLAPDGTPFASYRTTRSKADIESEYPRTQYSYPEITGKTSTVLDIWTPTENIVYIADEAIPTQKHDSGLFGEPPAIFQRVPIGSMMADTDSRKRWGESIFFMIRDLMPELNRLVSIMQSLNMKALDAALTYRIGEQILEAPEYEDLTKPGGVTETLFPDAVQQVPYGDVKRAATLLHAMIETRIQRASLSSTDLGTMSFPLSAVALVEIGEGRDQVFLPRLGSRGLLKQQLAEMFINQVLNLGVSQVELGTRGHKRIFDVKKLEGEYEVKFQYFVKSPQIDIARVSQAAAYGNLISEETKRRDILKLPKPEEEERKIRREMAERLSPALMMHRTIKSLLKDAEEGDEDAAFEAQILSAEMGVSLRQMMMGGGGQTPSVQSEQEPQQPLLPMYSRGNPEGMSSQAKAAQMQAQPSGEGTE